MSKSSLFQNLNNQKYTRVVVEIYITSGRACHISKPGVEDRRCCKYVGYSNDSKVAFVNPKSTGTEAGPWALEFGGWRSRLDTTMMIMYGGNGRWAMNIVSGEEAKPEGENNILSCETKASLSVF